MVTGIRRLVATAPLSETSSDRAPEIHGWRSIAGVLLWLLLSPDGGTGETSDGEAAETQTGVEVADAGDSRPPAGTSSGASNTDRPAATSNAGDTGALPPASAAARGDTTRPSGDAATQATQSTQSTGTASSTQPGASGADTRSTTSTVAELLLRNPERQLRDFGASVPVVFFSQNVLSS